MPQFQRKPPEPSEFPAVYPPFVEGGLQPGLAGTIIVRTPKTADRPGNTYLVIDRERGIIGELLIPAEQAIVGVGQQWLYVVTRDEDDIQRLSRHPVAVMIER